MAVLLGTGCLSGMEIGSGPGEEGMEGEHQELSGSCQLPVSAAAPASPPSSGTHDVVSGGALSYESLLNNPTHAGCPSDYSQVDYCYNTTNPPAPSIARRLSFGLPQYADGLTSGLEDAVETSDTSSATVGDSQILPFLRGTNDGRLMVRGEASGWFSTFVFRPERVGYDLTVGTGRSPVSRNSEIHALAWFNPVRTKYKVASPANAQQNNHEIWTLLGNGFTWPLHSTVCEVSSTSTQGGTRSPVPCRARYGTFSYFQRNPRPHDDQQLEGLCYQVTLLANSSVARTRDNLAQPGHWEMRSSPLTLFVPRAYTNTAGAPPNGSMHQGHRDAIWVYPQNPMGRLDHPGPDGVAQLPDYADYDLAKIVPWYRAIQDQITPVEWVTSPSLTFELNPGEEGCTSGVNCTRTLNAACYQQPTPGSGHWVARDPAVAPRFCQFLYNQSFSSQYRLDVNEDPVADRSVAKTEQWDGRGQYTLFEPTTTADGKLLLVNMQKGLMYSVNQAGPCQAAGFTYFHPISLLPKDPLARASYPLAQTPNQEPLRDPTGAFIPPGLLQPFAYPWVDREGKNLVFAALNEPRNVYKPNGVERITYRPQNPVPVITPDPTDERERYLSSMNAKAGHMVTVVGSWTQHKYVVLDNLLNASDFGGGGTFDLDTDGSGPDTHTQYIHRYRMDAYSDKSVQFIPKAVTLINSFQNQFGFFDALRPVQPFDVVWTMSSNNQFNTELVFDDYSSTRPFVVAHMNAAVRQLPRYSDPNIGGGRGPVEVMDGFYSTNHLFSGQPDFRFNQDPNRDQAVYLQNAATRSPVSMLRVRGGARIEPLAMGGVVGKGLYLDGLNDFVDLGYPVAGLGKNVYLSLWVDLRNTHADNEKGRVLFYFGNQHWLGLKRTAQGYVFYGRAQRCGSQGCEEQYRSLPLGALLTDGKYQHLATLVYTTKKGRMVDVFIDGTYVDTMHFPYGSRFTSGAELPFDPSYDTGNGWGWMALGSPYPEQCGGQGGCDRKTLKGWIDEFRMTFVTLPETYPHSYFRESLCNHALGTLVHAQGTLTNELAALQAKLQAVAPQASRPYLCEQLIVHSHGDPTDFPRQAGRGKLCIDKVHRNGGNEAACARKDLLLLRALHAEAPRPNFTGNAFCLSCHDDRTQSHAGLQLSALTSQPASLPPPPPVLSPGPVQRYWDVRRQPLNPPALLALPGKLCESSSGLSNSWYAAFGQSRGGPLSGSVSYPRGLKTTDHIFDEHVVQAVKAPGYFPPNP